MLVDAFLLMDDLEFAPEVDTAPGVLPREGSHGLVRSRTTSAIKPDYLERFFGESCSSGPHEIPIPGSQDRPERGKGYSGSKHPFGAPILRTGRGGGGGGGPPRFMQRRL